ncbi:MAG: metal ABC transporter permease [Marmoricola sp.]
MSFWEILGSPFMLRALLAAAVTGLAAPTVGTYLVQRRLALLGDGIGHICVTGVALGLLTGTSPTYSAVGIAVLGALAIELIRVSGRATADIALALLFYGGIADGLVLISLAGSGTAALQGYLFGSITSLSTSDLVVSVVLGGLVLVLSFTLLPQLFAVSNDEPFARTLGLRATGYNVLISVLAAVSVSVAMRTVGLLLVSALMVIPVATAQQFSRGFRSTMVAAMALGAAAGVIGLTTTAYVDIPSGPTIVLVALAGFVLTAPVGVLVQRRRAARVPFPVEQGEAPFGREEHAHQHGPGCGHLAVEHGDHVDYLHDGHRHAVHGGHYDEH